MTNFNSEHQLQAARIHSTLDRLEKSGYIKRKGKRLIAQLYFTLTEKGETLAAKNIDADESALLKQYGVDKRSMENAFCASRILQPVCSCTCLRTVRF